MARFSTLGTYGQLVETLETLETLPRNDHWRNEMAELVKDFHEAASANKVRNLTMSGVGLGGLPAILDRIDVLVDEFGPELPDTLNDTYLGNLAFLSATTYWAGFPYFKEGFPTAGHYFASMLLAREGNFEKTLCAIKNDRNLMLAPGLCLNLSLRAQTLGDGERDAIKLFNSRMSFGPGFHPARTALYRRMEKIVSREPVKVVSESRLALLVCGQIRGFDQMKERFKQYFKLEDFDVYISTWDVEGYTPIDRPRIQRRVEAKAKETVRELYSDDDLAKIADAELKIRREKDKGAGLAAKLEEAFAGAKNLHMHLANEDRVVYQQMDNPAKMHFHNGYWISKLGEQHFRDNYDYIVKIRPDFVMSDYVQLSEETMSDPGSDLFVDHPVWMSEVWGFGMGDQFFWGRTETMLPVLNIQFPQSLSTRIMVETLERCALFRGHMNVGMELWINGGNPLPITLKKYTLASEPPMSFEQFQQLADAAGVKKGPDV